MGLLGFSGDSDSKKSTYSVGDLGLIPGLGRSPGWGHGNPLQYSGESLWTEEPGGLRFMGSRRVGHDWATDLIWSDLKDVSSSISDALMCLVTVLYFLAKAVRTFCLLQSIHCPAMVALVWLREFILLIYLLIPNLPLSTLISAYCSQGSHLTGGMFLLDID